jgi:hypothetical protein
MTGCQHHQSKNTFAIDLIVVFLHANIAWKTVRDLNELRSGPGMDSKLIGDSKIFTGHRYVW